MAFLGVWLCGKNDTPHNDTTTQAHNDTSPHKKRPYSPAKCVIVQSTVAKPKTKPYTVKKVDRKVIPNYTPNAKSAFYN